MSTDFDTERSACGSGSIVTVYGCVAVVLPFVACMTNGYVPVAVGVPVIDIAVVDAVELPSAKPVGKVPDATDHVNGPTAVPVAVSVCAYGSVMVPSGNVPGAIASVALGVVSENVTMHVVLVANVPLHPTELVTSYPAEVVVAMTE